MSLIESEPSAASQTARRSFYRQEADLFVPTRLNVSPWTGKTQNGMALAGLLAHLIEGSPAPAPMLTARLTIDILGAPPIEPLQGAVRIIRDGKRMQMLEAELVIGERTWARATALRTRIMESPPFEDPNPYAVPPDIVPDGPGVSRGKWWETVAIPREQRVKGRKGVWLRLPVDVIEGVPLSPLSRFAISGDFGGGMAIPLPYEQWTFANLDIALFLNRLPEGEWLLLDAGTHSAGLGLATGHTRFGDSRSLFGYALQTHFLDHR
jgi:hypothetical protein